MKKLFLMALMAVVTVLQMQAQVAHGGWEAYTTEDEYTGKKNHYLRYFDDKERWTASFFPGPNKLGVLEWYDGVLFMDETEKAVLEHHGKLPEKDVDYEWRVELPKGDSEEDFGTVKMKFGRVEHVGDTFFGTFVFDVDCNDLMAGRWIAVRWHDPLRQEQVVKRIPLAGFTKCYDEVLRRYGVKRKK